MSGFVKRMMSLAKEWLTENPIYGEKLRVPRSHSSRFDALLKGHSDQAKDVIARARAAGLPGIDAAEFEVAQALDNHRKSIDSIIESEAEVNEIINNPLKGYRAIVDQSKRESLGNDDPFAHVELGAVLLQWARDNYNVFDLSPDFVSAMLLTDPSSIDPATLRLPFHAMLVLLPDKFVVGADGVSYTKIFVGEIEGKDIEGGPWTKFLTIYATNGSQVFLDMIPMHSMRWGDIEALPDDVTDETDIAARRSIQQIVFGMLAYLTSVHEGSERRETSNKRKATSDPVAQFWDVGRTVKIDKKLVSAVRGGAREVAFRLKHRHIVRGHDRNQPHGKGRTLRTMKWISPFWKGPEDGAALVHTYKVETS